MRGGPLSPQGLPPLVQGKGGKFLHAIEAMIHTERICFTSRKSQFEILHIPEQCFWASHLLIPFAYKLAALHKKSWRDSLVKIVDHANGTRERTKGGNGSKRAQHFFKILSKESQTCPLCFRTSIYDTKALFPQKQNFPSKLFPPSSPDH